MTSVMDENKSTGKTAEMLLAEGWNRGCVYDDPRLSEVIEMYQELGFEVTLLPVSSSDAECTECMLKEPGRFWVLYTRKRNPGG